MLTLNNKTRTLNAATKHNFYVISEKTAKDG